MRNLEKHCAGKMVEITEERYNDVMNILPPHRLVKKNGAESFICPEPIDFGIHDYFVSLRGHYFVKPCKISRVYHDQIVAEAFIMLTKSKSQSLAN